MESIVDEDYGFAEDVSENFRIDVANGLIKHIAYKFDDEQSGKFYEEYAARTQEGRDTVSTAENVPVSEADVGFPDMDFADAVESLSQEQHSQMEP